MSYTRYYTITEEDGDVTRFRYITNSCHCCGDCYDGILEVEMEPNSDDWIPLKIEGRELKFLMMLMIERSAEFEKL